MAPAVIPTRPCPPDRPNAYYGLKIQLPATNTVTLTDKFENYGATEKSSLYT